MSTYPPGTDPTNDPTVRELVASATADIGRIVSGQIELAKLEMQESARSAGKAAGLVAGALYVLTLFVFFALFTIAYVLVQVGLPVWAGFGIVAVALLVLTVILAAIAKSQAAKVKGPERTVAQLNLLQQKLGGIGDEPTAPPPPTP